MRYEVYKQDNDDKVSEKVKRFYTDNKTVAFRFMDEKNKLEKRNVWRVAMCVNNRVSFDIDIEDKDNLKLIYNYYSKLYNTEFEIHQTTSGYHLFSQKKYKDKLEWQYDVCRVLNPILEKGLMQKYIEELIHTAKELIRKQSYLNESRQTFLDFYNDEIRKSGLFTGIGIFDMYFCTHVIATGYYCIRISKKSKDDKIERIIL